MDSKRKNLLRIGHLKLKNWRNFSSIDIELSQRVFLVGPNASGKSNFLDAFRFLADIVAVGGGFEAAVQKRGGVSSLRCLAARVNPDIVLNIILRSSESNDCWEYEIAFSQDSQKRPILKREIVKKNERVQLSRPDKDDDRDKERLRQTQLQQVTANKDYREIADFLSKVKYLHVVPQLIREPDRSVGRKNDPFGGDFLERIASTSKRARESRLRIIGNSLKFAVPQLSDLKLEIDNLGRPHLRGKYKHWRPRGAWQEEGVFSDGTLRMIGLLWSILDGDGPLLLEEPELSLHSEVVRALPQVFWNAQRKSGRQIFISTHSAELLRDDGIGLHEVLLLEPSESGTQVKPSGSFVNVKHLLDSGMTLPDIVIPMTKPKEANQLMFLSG